MEDGKFGRGYKANPFLCLVPEKAGFEGSWKVSTSQEMAKAGMEGYTWALDHLGTLNEARDAASLNLGAEDCGSKMDKARTLISWRSKVIFARVERWTLIPGRMKFPAWDFWG